MVPRQVWRIGIVTRVFSSKDSDIAEQFESLQELKMHIMTLTKHIRQGN